MAVQFLPHEGLPGYLNNFSTLVAQNRGYHFYFPDGMVGLNGSVQRTSLEKPYYTGLTPRVFSWIGDTAGGIELSLSAGTSAYYTGINVEGTKVAISERPLKSPDDQRINKVAINGSSVQVPGYYTMALRLELPSHILVIFGEDTAIYRSEQPGFMIHDWFCHLRSSGSAAHHSLHMSDELKKRFSAVILQPNDTFYMWYNRKVFVVIECQVIDITQDIVVSFRIREGISTGAIFPPSGLKKNDVAIIFVRDTPDGYVVGTSFSPDFEYVEARSKYYRMYPNLSGNCLIYRMRWECMAK